MVMAVLAERQPFERYQSILDRHMFGVPPVGFDPTKPPSEVSKSAAAEESAQQAQIRSAIRFSAINVTPEGDTAVGFTDSSDPKNPIHYYLKVGETRNGWFVKEADPVKATMTIAKGEVEVMLTIGGDSSKSPDAAKSTAAGRPATKRPMGLLSAANSGDASAQEPRRPGDLRSRRLLRAKMRQEQAEEEAARREEEAARREEERRRAEEEKAQREAEREENRAQLLQIQEELRKAREARAAEEAQRAAQEAQRAEQEETVQE